MYVKITDTDPGRRECHAQDSLVCRVDDLAEALLQAGWLGSLPPVASRDALYALQRAVLAGADATALERALAVAVERKVAVVQAFADTDDDPLPPVGAVIVDPWQPDDAGGRFRVFHRPDRHVGDAATVGVAAHQAGSGEIRHSGVLVDICRWGELTPTQARELAEHLLAAAREAEAGRAGDPMADALARCRDNLLAARADAALVAGGAGLGTPAAEPALWIVEAVEAVLRDLDRLTGASSDWDAGDDR